MLRSPRRNASLAAMAAALVVGGCSPEADVYVAGWESNGTVQVAKVWKNGAAMALSDGTHGALATAVAGSGGDVYVAGGVNLGGADIATYWKNSAAVVLTDGTTQAFAEAIAVSGADVYVAGYQGATAMYWKNGAPVALTDGTYGADAKAVAVSGGDVYVAGYEIEATEIAPGSFLVTNVAKVWKNGVAMALTDGRNPAVARDIAVVGPDVYVAGYELADALVGWVFVAKVWKNGIPAALSDGIYGAKATGIAVWGSDVLVAGGQYDGILDVARIWRNGVPSDLTYPSSQGLEVQAFAEAIAVWRGDVYAAGYHGATAMYWKNGEPVALTDGRFQANAQAIAVVER